jgi:hypothetical protein
VYSQRNALGKRLLQLAIALVTGFALLARRLLAKSDDYGSEGKPTLADLWTRGGGGDPGPGG